MFSLIDVPETRNASKTCTLYCCRSACGTLCRRGEEKSQEPADGLGAVQGDERILHALNRLTFGARPGDLATVRQIGLQAWIDKQLKPESVAENAARSKRGYATSIRCA